VAAAPVTASAAAPVVLKKKPAAAKAPAVPAISEAPVAPTETIGPRVVTHTKAAANPSGAADLASAPGSNPAAVVQALPAERPTNANQNQPTACIPAVASLGLCTNN
jgi:hypothetical protein